MSRKFPGGHKQPSIANNWCKAVNHEAASTPRIAANRLPTLSMSSIEEVHGIRILPIEIKFDSATHLNLSGVDDRKTELIWEFLFEGSRDVFRSTPLIRWGAESTCHGGSQPIVRFH